MIFDYDHYRQQYLNHRLSHREFYLNLAIAIGLDDLVSLAPITASQSKDKYLNDVPLKLWDEKFPEVRFLLKRAIHQGRVVKKTNGLSLSKSVCLLKEIAKEKELIFQ